LITNPVSPTGNIMIEIKNTQLIKEAAKSAGFDHCGIAKAGPLDEDARRLESWLHKGMQGSMHYMERFFDLRVNPEKLFPGARSVITLLLNYFPQKLQAPDAPKIAKYAYGEDYHDVIRVKMNSLLARIKTEIGDVHGRGFVDSAPVLERSWALKSGLGWIGKNGNIIHKKQGSYFFIATLIVDLELSYDDPFTADHCGTCTRCVDACPTEAILDNKIVDAGKCISYFTIELKDQLIPDKMKGKFDDWMFGCDICQDVCPWNRFSKPTTETAFTPIAEILEFSTRDWEEMTEEQFKKIFKNSPLKRSRFAGIKRNLQFIKA
jgi:epoxyqueuosine reductase